jgi:ATP-dependent Clp protease ATP-binding subunit ClpC
MKSINFAGSTQVVLAKARKEAIGLQHDFIGTEHIALALLTHEETLAVFGRLGIDPAKIRRIARASIRRGKATVHLGQLPYTSRAKKVIEFAMMTTGELNDQWVRPSYLLVSLLLEEKGIAAEVLGQVGITLEGVLKHLPPGVDESAPTPEADLSPWELIAQRLRARIRGTDSTRFRNLP